VDAAERPLVTGGCHAACDPDDGGGGDEGKMGTPRVPPCVPRPVQLRHTCSLSGEAYVARRAWRDASLAACPRHPRGGCGLVRHGTYGRRTPVGMRIARYYCPTAHETFSLLPDCLASRFPGALDPIEQVVATVETARSVAAAKGKGTRSDYRVSCHRREGRSRTPVVSLPAGCQGHRER